MAIIHRATITPTKQELLEAWLAQRPWGGSGPVEILGGYRYDDPAGEVGVEGLVVVRGDAVLHVPLTYRGAPEPSAELVATMDHSALGPRWVYDATTDPVALDCYQRALAGELEQAVAEVWDGDTFVGVREPAVRVTLEGSPATGPLTFVHDLSESPAADSALVATWEGGRGVVAYLGSVGGSTASEIRSQR